jgi:hypothetical protein
MSFDTYTNLQAEIVDYLARDDLNAKIPSFIALTEAKLNRELFVRQMELRETSAVDLASNEPEFVSLPSDFQSMRRIRLNGITGKPQLAYMSTAALDEYRASIGNVSAQPKYFTVFGDEMEFAPTPDLAYTLEMVYRGIIPPLASNSTNWLLTLAPDVYLYGALLEAMPYIKKDDRIQVWVAGFASAIDSLNKLGMTSTFNAGPLQVRTSGALP